MVLSVLLLILNARILKGTKVISATSLVISMALKKELDAKLQDFSSPDTLDESFENKEQIEISRNYERMPKPTLIATQELIDDQLVFRSVSKDEQLK